MMVGIGIDAVSVVRFADWHRLPMASLQRLFRPDEITYCLASERLSAQRFAARFAAREAFFKALSDTGQLPFLTICRAVEVVREASGAPSLRVDWQLLARHNPRYRTWQPRILISLTHTATDAIACVALYESI